MKRLIILAVLVMQAGMLAQNIRAAEGASSNSWKPHPVLMVGPSLVGNGYQPLALNGGAGLLINSSRVVTDLEARYMNARKTNDNTVNNTKGHERYLQSRLFY